jgi:hypothetical protein
LFQASKQLLEGLWQLIEAYPGLPHVTMYPITGGRGSAEDYFGTKEEACLERDLRFSNPGN